MTPRLNDCYSQAKIQIGKIYAWGQCSSAFSTNPGRIIAGGKVKLLKNYKILKKVAA
jgi:hypothetical protein